MKKVMKGDKAPGMMTRASLAAGVWVVVTLMASPAWAGTSSGGGQLAQKAQSGFQWILDALTSPALTVFATIMFIAAIAAAYFGNMGDAFKRGLQVAGITFFILSGASIMAQVVDAAGALI